jgi:head-tail adaptor
VNIKAGDLDRRATLLAPTNVRNAVGEVTQSYASAGQRWVSMMALRASEVDREPTPGSKAEAKLLLRLDALTKTVGVRWRVAVDGVTYNVFGTEPDYGNGSLMLFIAGVQS